MPEMTDRPIAAPERRQLPAPPGLARRLVLVLAVATGVAVANNYYAQPLLEAIRRSFHSGPGEAGLVVTAAQIGYAVGLIFLLPLGDLIERRRLAVVMSLVCAGGLLAYAAAPDMGVLFAAAVLVGGTSVLAQVLVAFAASLAREAERGRIVGSVMSGLLLGILLARTVAGYIAQASSWRVVYVVAAGLTALVGLVSYFELPRFKEEGSLSYPAALSSVLQLFRNEPVLRRRSFYGFLSFGAFSVLWTTLAFLLSGAPYHYSTGTIGLFGLVGAAGAGMAQVGGRLADRGHQALVTLVTAAAILAAFVLLSAAPRDLAGLVVAVILLDLGCQGLHISNQSEIYKLAPKAKSRVNAVYMTSYFIGGTVGSVGAALCYGAAGWGATAGIGMGFGGAAFLVSLGERRYSARRATL